MTARLFRCTIKNSGQAPIRWVKDHLDHGEWAEGSLPSQAAGLINPGQSGHYQAESGGDIPILSSIMTGTEGWVAFRTTNTSGTSEFFKISHFLPYWSPRRGASVETMRFDPTIAPGSGEFDTRDTTPATISVKRTNFFSPHDELAEAQSLPWLVFWSVGQIFTQPYGDFHWHLNIEVTNTAPAASTTIPFSSTPPSNIDSQSFRFSSPEMWRGVWDSDDRRVTAVISVLPNKLLKVRIVERSPDGTEQTIEATDLPISRTKSFEIASLFDPIPFLRDHAEVLSQLPRMVQVERQGGNEFELLDIITREHPLHSVAVEAVQREFEIGSFGLRPRELGGDYLSLPNDAVLEIEEVTADGTVIGYGLRYVRPGFVPVLVFDSIDTRLHRRMVLN
ncbi:hypothetical protein [Mesorhizobium sp.]|uniref:hypothetical protein n=1 Tax=Mesorhizobium sp. TaxID=1871066 RepID=UPI000FE753EC|nr:hypothetical protein [Mesorhizobium sp.]RWO54662.1 MAG: hypothetical protein EOS13_05630 [Mesorhizobium sp.]TIN27692.1 MAG: hypothetical protein E5Y19_10470 [Mesorhizobium sp.]TIN40289.1 MAG: hypothetical protein E5Y13_10810 [Mesorhizobium sp.]TJU87493.1 MAG: hypothetical protein E5Y15_07690 [Mesorhizobium sp.]TJU90742.1 MAG: hypothetical protein E5Y10_09945 [Mesorhizobium sp.]